MGKGWEKQGEKGHVKQREEIMNKVGKNEDRKQREMGGAGSEKSEMRRQSEAAQLNPKW